MNTLLCPACQTANSTSSSTCSVCGASLTEALVQQQIAKLKETAAQVADTHKPAPGLKSFNGCGTTLLDYRPHGDGTYEATQWFTLFYLPLIPLAAWTVKPIQREASLGHETYRYERLRQEKLKPMHVLGTYLLTVLAVVPVLFAFCRMDLVNRWVGSSRGFFVTLAALVWCGFLFYKISNSDSAFRGKGA
jgi:hypothetical protein